MKLTSLLVCLIALFATPVFAADDYSFQQEKMKVDRDGIFIISSFDNSDVVAAYSFSGFRIWEAPFHAKIISWEVVDDQIIIFSKDRQGSRTYLDALNKYTGKLTWEKS